MTISKVINNSDSSGILNYFSFCFFFQDEKLKHKEDFLKLKSKLPSLAISEDKTALSWVCPQSGSWSLDSKELDSYKVVVALDVNDNSVVSVKPVKRNIFDGHYSADLKSKNDEAIFDGQEPEEQEPEEQEEQKPEEQEEQKPKEKKKSKKKESKKSLDS